MRKGQHDRRTRERRMRPASLLAYLERPMVRPDRRRPLSEPRAGFDRRQLVAKQRR